MGTDSVVVSSRASTAATALNSHGRNGAPGTGETCDRNALMDRLIFHHHLPKACQAGRPLSLQGSTEEDLLSYQRISQCALVAGWRLALSEVGVSGSEILRELTRRFLCHHFRDRHSFLHQQSLSRSPVLAVITEVYTTASALQEVIILVHCFWCSFGVMSR